MDRDAVVAAARSWVGTPYHHRGRVKGAGVDCAMLVLMAFVEAGGVEFFDPGLYTPDWHLHRSEERYLAAVEHRLIPSAPGDCSFLSRLGTGWAPTPGDVLMWRVGRTFSHAAIVSSPVAVVHASFPARVVEEIGIKGSILENRAMKVYTHPEYNS